MRRMITVGCRARVAAPPARAPRPVRTFTAAQNATNAGGVISVLDSGDYSGISITKSLTIRAEGVDGGATILAV